MLFDVPPDCFLPAPKVTSAVLRCRRRAAPPFRLRCGEVFFFQVVRAAFAQRRKTLLNSLSSVYGARLGKAVLADILERCGFSPTVRGEQLQPADLARLADALAAAIEA